MTAAIVCSDLTFAWPDGAPVLSGVTGVVRSGTVRTDGDVGYLPRPSPWGPIAAATWSASPPPRDALHAWARARLFARRPGRDRSSSARSPTCPPGASGCTAATPAPRPRAAIPTLTWPAELA